MESPMEYRVWAIEYEQHVVKPGVGRVGRWKRATVAVSAESEYGAIKRLCGNRECLVRRVMLTDLKPQWAQRRIEGSPRVRDFEWPKDWPLWEYT